MAPHSISPPPTPVRVWSDHNKETSSSRDYAKLDIAEPIAIIGLACRYPGEASSGPKLWDLLINERSGQCDFPATRFNIDAFYKPQKDPTGAINMRGGYFIQEDLRNFENEFFGINNAEATYMDPQQRKILEVVFECFESAGVPIEKLSGSNTGCYLGNFTSDHMLKQLRDIDGLHRYGMSGMGVTILANRISYVFNLKGPSMVVDTACSSSMYGLHLACTALKTGDCDGAIVAGTNLINSIEGQASAMRTGVLSKTSTCHSFDASADGYGRADGVGALYLKRLSDAIRDGDPIRSVIRGTALNANGRTQGISLPSVEYQEKVIKKAYAKAGLNLDDTTYVECHGTGTPVGDPIEVESVSRVFNRPGRIPLRIGSIKPSVGHCEAASAIASIIKVTMAMENNFIPPTIGITQINPNIPCAEWGVEIVRKGQNWSTPDGLLRAGVNSFGYGGANGHAILENAAAHLPRNYSAASEVIPYKRTKLLLPLSGSTDNSLRARLNDLSTYNLRSVTIQDFAHTLGSRRSFLEKRAYLLTSPRSYHEDLNPANLRTISVPVRQNVPPFAFVFNGQGAQWPQMCMELFDEFAVFRNAIAEMDSVLQKLPHAPRWHLKDILCDSKATSRIQDPVYSQPACTAVQVGLVLLLQSWGVKPKYVIGHSSGEISAAFAAGFISLAEAIKIAFYRGYSVRVNNLDGAMIAAGISQDQADSIIQNLQLVGKVRVACINSQESVTISGDAPAIDKMLGELQAQKLFARKLQTQGRAYHSHHMLEVGDEYESLLKASHRWLGVSSKLETGPVWVSSVNGQVMSQDVVSSSYWRTNLESPVEFYKAVTELTRVGAHHVIEIGPHSTLELPIKQIRTKLGISEDNLAYSPTIIRNKNSIESILGMAGVLYLYGHAIDFDKINGLDIPRKSEHSGVNYRVLHDLPNYHWTYSESPLWYEPRLSSELSFRKYARHELLGSKVPGGNGIEHSWKNIIRLDESLWLADHKLNDMVVFPGAGYIAIVIEALRQIVEPGAECAVTLKNMKIMSALVIPNDRASVPELLTTLRPTQLTYATNSSEWWDFSIVSFYNGISTTHATGSALIAPNIHEKKIERVIQAPKDSLESSASRVWYEKFLGGGLNFGPEFQTITDFGISRLRNLYHCDASVTIQRQTGDDIYPIHPITIDAMLQASLVATAAGNTRDFRARIPTSIGLAVFTLNNEIPQGDWLISSNAEITGFNTAHISSELIKPDGVVKARLENVRVTVYQGPQKETASEQRYPMLRVLWKPDATPGMISSEGLSRYLDSAAKESGTAISQPLVDLMACVDTIGHKNPYLNVLELGGGISDLTNSAIETLMGQTSFPHMLSYTIADFNTERKLVGSKIKMPIVEVGDPQEMGLELKFDLVLLPSSEISAELLSQKLIALKPFLAAWGTIVLVLPEINTSLQDLGFSVAESRRDGFVIALLNHIEDANQVDPQIKKSPVIIIENSSNSLNDSIAKEIKHTIGTKPIRVSFNEVSAELIPQGSTVISLVEVQSTVLGNTTECELNIIKTLTNQASSLIWVTNGNLLKGERPDHSLAFGLARAVMTEQPSLRFFAYDIDNINTEPSKSARNIVSLIKRTSPGLADFEFIEKEGTVHVSRFMPDNSLNRAFRQNQEAETVKMPLAVVQKAHAQLSIKNPGNFNTLFFNQIHLPELKPHEVQISVKCVGLNAKDFYSLGGRVDTKNATCILEFSGVIEKIGQNVTNLSVGDRVCVMAPGFFRTSEVVPDWACIVLNDDEDFDSISTIPVVYATAIYALHNRANLQQGESVLIHSGAGGVGIAAIQVAQLAGAKIFTTVSTDDKRQFLIENFQIDPNNIFSSRDSSFESDLMKATNGAGVDVVLNSLTGDLLHASWRCCGPFGRFVEIGKKDLLESGRLPMEQFLKNTTYSAFDFSDFYNSSETAHHMVWASLMKKGIELYREKKIKRFPLAVFDIEDLPKAFKTFGSKNRIGKIVVNMEKPESVLDVRLFRYSTKLSADKSYLMIGCLGGLGRSLTKWMVERGARKFVFLGRSGLDKEAARRLIDDLTSLGAECKVVRGDVVSAIDVENMVAEADAPIGGVVQAAMGLKHSLFGTMSNEYWHSGLDSKVRGTWNIYNKLKGKDQHLDFFLLTSSISGSAGTPTESNYCAANYFLDNFARYLRSRGIPATAVGLGMISEVGYLHENPEAEKMLLRKGMQQITESEMLSIIDISLTRPMQIPRSYDTAAIAHVLTGLEPFAMLKLREQGLKGSDLLKTSRASIMSRAIYEQEVSRGRQDGHGNLPKEISKLKDSGVPLLDAITICVTRQFSELVLVAADKLNTTKPLHGYGLDSMFAAEFRSWLYRTFKVDISFLELLDSNTTIQKLGKIIAEKIEVRK
ncbi:hypothetical protein TWF569_001295 [Orbilia oligospora]|uniref:Uncharacterized protein n=1 Tax=Orbilia oligospora TaxID=2813651 RepID=A0A7C8NG80_ORBOL|nr:hypothetical protein TWF706_007733 [Orbilia oligospora]KAF3105332.1 hypothetical protein TWF102_002261 [Orbilia oligospora]KAF3112494.1 hypothetical protein TWF103_003256 [Orbilia oligospora]KAF3124378.1 hypothetical protein TWF569_001295 [Orbilia oligospora]KAF3143487.1 hypothetical protein TWF594_005044 [Orbilia oligospora]